jgi:hypothetical protein
VLLLFSRLSWDLLYLIVVTDMAIARVRVWTLTIVLAGCVFACGRRVVCDSWVQRVVCDSWGQRALRRRLEH